MAENKYLNTIIQVGLSFIFGFLFIVFLVAIGGSIFIGKTDVFNKQDKSISEEIPLSTYSGTTYSLKYPSDYQLSENKIIATEGIVAEQDNTIHLISPKLPNSDGNLSIIITFKPLKKYEEENTKSSTCPQLNGIKLKEIKIGTQIFTTSGQIFCGPNEVAFFYLLNNENVYEVKVETTADYETQAFPEVLKILKTMKFKN